MISDSAHIKGQLAKAGSRLADKWDVLEIYQRIEMIKRVLEKVIVSRAEVTLQLSPIGLRASLMNEPSTEVKRADQNQGKPIRLDIPVQLKRCGIESKLVIPAGPEPTMHPRTVRVAQEALLKALHWHQELAKGETKSFLDIARREGLPSTYVRRVYRLTSLSPKAMQVIVSGQIPEPLALEALRAGFPLDWKEQKALFRT